MARKDLIEIEAQPISQRSIEPLLEQIRPVWKGKNLIGRVTRLIPVDPSSACQRLFNAATHDLREKVIIAGIDLAQEAAKNYKLPPVTNEESILDYPTSKLIDLCYRIGILKRPEWRRLHRCYEIRRDLEHEDNEYEAVLEDCIYIFKSSIDIVLSQDPVELLRVIDVKQVIEEPVRITVTEDFLNNYERAPSSRRFEIMQFLISAAKNPEQPDIVRENSFELLRHLKNKTEATVIIDIAKKLEERMGKKMIDLTTAKIAHACGAFGYFKKSKVKDYYNHLYKEFDNADTDWAKQTKIMTKFEDIGSFYYCPKDLRSKFLKKMVLFYIGEKGGYGYFGKNREVFFSDGAAPIISRIIRNKLFKLSSDIEKLRNKESIKRKISNRHILRRFENLIDAADGNI